MTDAELIALSSIIVAHATEIKAANDDRQTHGYSMAYNGFNHPALDVLTKELERRGVFSNDQ